MITVCVSMYLYVVVSPVCKSDLNADIDIRDISLFLANDDFHNFVLYLGKLGQLIRCWFLAMRQIILYSVPSTDLKII